MYAHDVTYADDALSVTDTLLDRLDAQYSALEAELGLLRDVLASIPGAAVFVVTKDLVMLAAGGELLSRNGFFAEHLQGRPLADVVSSEELRNLYKAAVDGNAMEHMLEWCGIRFRVNISPLRARYSSVSGAVAIALEVDHDDRPRDNQRASG